MTIFKSGSVEGFSRKSGRCQKMKKNKEENESELMPQTERKRYFTWGSLGCANFGIWGAPTPVFGAPLGCANVNPLRTHIRGPQEKIFTHTHTQADGHIERLQITRRADVVVNPLPPRFFRPEFCKHTHMRTHGTY